MPETRAAANLRVAFRQSPCQGLAIAFCVLFSVAMIANTQMGGEALWFFYARSLHGGLRLYADLHLALQPLFVLENDVWMQFFGIRTLVTEIPSVIHALALALGMFLMLRESDWPDWQKAIVLASAFLLSVNIGAYRFDDFHVTADIFSLYSLVALLWIANAKTTRQRLVLAVWLGILSGLTIMTRLNEGGALLVASLLSLLFLARTKKLLVACLFLLAVVLTVVLVVRVIGDSFSAFIANGVLGAAATKGVERSNILARPWLQFTNSLHFLRSGKKWILLWVFAIIAAAPMTVRYLQKGVRYLVPLQLCIAAAGLTYASHALRVQLLTGTLVSELSVFSVVVAYVLAPLVAARYLNSTDGFGSRPWDGREILLLLPLAGLAARAASNAGLPDPLFLSPHSMLLLLVPVIQPFRKYAVWANPSFVTLMALLGLACMTAKIHEPYSWNNFTSRPMFDNRQWYSHPVYGPMYIDRDLLHFVEPICEKISHGNPNPELLSLPYSYPNYFCATPPWRGYVQTYFDTSSRSTINRLMAELNTAPPQWIVYQRQLTILTGTELLTPGQPLAHRDLDTLIMQKIATGQWQLIDKVNYLEGDGWFIIKTRP